MVAGTGWIHYEEKRDWGLWFEDLTSTIEEGLTIVGAVLIAVLVFGLPIFLMVADHVSPLSLL